MSQPRYDFAAGTFQFFIAVGRRPMGALWIAAWQLVLIGAATAAMIAVFWPLFELMSRAGEMDVEAEMAAVVMQVMGLIILITLAFLVFALMFQGAWLRLLTRDEIKPGIPFRLGGDEIRLLGVNLIFIAFWTLAYLLTIALVAVIVAVAGGADGFGGTAAVALAGTIAVIAALVAIIMICLRFAAAPALSVHQRRFRLFEAVSASKNVAGMMFLSYLTLIVVWIAGAVVISMIQQVAILFGAADLMAQLMRLDEGGDPQVMLALLGETLTSTTGIVVLSVIILSQYLFQIAFEGLWHGVGAYVAKRHGDADAAIGAEAAAPAPETAG
ncbi:hypothetical protein F1654_01565 [Alkalicaulis satelles]|uniref:Glycerophosphoryl diester phosphodiesterase membrane domain-containing protein n=1 Tax=Alkalicaulis satelles TaxID=2609175 RepID=A0A5M6ZM03_9PROT|nr:hypothetical protein [Alkalicaulis satelles]KAA5804717.1 hypothetical protein F1654_01565 [Alkalicaulis satelles]